MQCQCVYSQQGSTVGSMRIRIFYRLLRDIVRRTPILFAQEKPESIHVIYYFKEQTDEN